MMFPYMFRCEMEPVAKARPRITRSGRTYTPAKTANAETVLRTAMRKFAAGKSEFPLNVACHVTINFFMKRPTSKKKAEHVTVRPDLDNYLKLVMDAGNGILWKDDSYVTKIVCSKAYADEKSHVSISFDSIF